MYDTRKLRERFPATSVYKDQSIISIFKIAKISAFLRDWILKRKSRPDGSIEGIDSLSEYIDKIIPRREEKSRLEDEARSYGETRQFLARVEVSFDFRSNCYSFELPDLGFSHSQTLIEDYIWGRVKGELLGETGGWGLVKVGYLPPENGKKNGRFTLLDYQNFCPYEVNVDAYRDARSGFTADEWMDILLGAIDYNPDGYEGTDLKDIEVWDAKHTMLTRLLPFIEPRVNMIELAPQQTGKSYIFGKTGKYGYMAGGGSMSRAKLFHDMRPGAKASGIVTYSDFVAIDEIKSIKFANDLEMQGILKNYMEDGFVNVGGVRVDGDAGIILLGNIALDDMDGARDMFREIPGVFRDAALLERFHGIIPGRKIPPLKDSNYINDWALNTEYFTEIMHKLRVPSETLKYRGLVEELVKAESSEGVDGREKEAVYRLCTAYLKLFFPHADSTMIRDSDFRRNFQRFCLGPATGMRETVLQQMKIVDPTQFRGRSMATYILRDG